MIPDNKQVAVEKALRRAFGVSEFEEIRQLTKGLSSALIFKIVVRGESYLLRVITRTDAMGDPTYYFGCMELAASAGLAPSIYYLSTDDRISITGFVEEHSFATSSARKIMPQWLRRLHALPRFSYRFNYFDRMESFMEKFKACNMLPAEAIDNVFDIYARIASVYPRNDEGDLVSCHNDLKPENVLFDGIRPWLVDWEGAFPNDRYLDLAVVGNFVLRNERDEADYLEQYFTEPADEYEHARFFMMCQMLHVYYFTFLMLSGSAGNPVDINNFKKPGFRLFHDRMWDGEITLTTAETKLQYAWEHRAEFLRKAETDRFEDSLQILASRDQRNLVKTELPQ